MKAIDPALAHFAESLKRIVETDDASGLRDALVGRTLPALGGDLDPAEIIRRAITQSGQYPAHAPRLARLLAAVIADTMSDFAASGKALNPQRRHLLLNALHLAAELPAGHELFESLKELLRLLRSSPRAQDAESLWLPLWRAFVYQQTDDSLQGEWFSILGSSDDWTPARRTLLLLAWSGLLWIPPDPERQRAGEIVNFPRVEAGLLALHRAVDGREEGPSLLGSALDILTHTFPRSAEFWETRFGGSHLFLIWPSNLKEVATQKWPGLREVATPPQQSSEDSPTLNQGSHVGPSGASLDRGRSSFRRDERHLTKIFRALSDGTRQEILRLLEDQHRTVSEIVGSFNVSSPTISHHLKVLKEADLVIEQRQDQDTTYRFNEHWFDTAPFESQIREAKARPRTSVRQKN